MELQLWGDNGTQNLKLIKISFKSSWVNLGTLLWCFMCICRDKMFFKIIIGDICIFMEQQKKGNSSTKNHKLIKLVSNLTDYFL